ncbi:hypothetical protein B0A50_05662 [Salinomyces thailandicus]|uniref:N-acetylgalactosaminide beta-1,3-galactosyltransferase n=1 Tax=Salinomyces thailandicus TaxID=706561 RepID=A0A4U0TUN0_9PEZI|nr:hypothetical protein B0A50_05662 [Salinomyces thailandica]
MLSAQRIVLAVGCLLCIGLFAHLWRTTPAVRAGLRPQSAHTSRPTDHKATVSTSLPPSSGFADCSHLKGLEDIVFVLKTGATEIYEKLPIHLATTFACATDFLLYSDLEQQFGPLQVHDALALVSEDARDRHEDLAQYRRLKEHVASGADAAELKGERSWALDKWKFLPMIADAYMKHGEEKRWYVFLEADTYVSMHNLLLFLRTLDAKGSVFAGAQVMIGDTEFAHGGSGIVLSSAAVKAFVYAYATDQSGWEEMLVGECCGDKVVADVLLKASPPITVHKAFPLIQGETLSSLDWSEGHWCEPAVTWHHVDAAGIDKLWQFDREWRESKGPGEPILFMDYFDAFINPRLVAANGIMHGWDNLGSDWSFEEGQVESTSYESPQACEEFCREEERCLQWSWSPGLCKAGKAVQLGWALKNRPALGSADDRIKHLAQEDSAKAVSGWFLDRIEDFRNAHAFCDRSLWQSSRS